MIHVSDAVMSCLAPLVLSSSSRAPINSSNVNNDLTFGRQFGILIPLAGRLICDIAKTRLPPHNRDTISCFLRPSGSGESFPGSLTSPQRWRADIRRPPVGIVAGGG